MVKIKGINVRPLLCLLTGILTGFLAGASCISAVVSYRIDNYLQKINYLESVIEDRNVQLERLEESINKNKFVLKDVEVNLMFEGDEIEKVALAKHIKDKYDQLLGQEIKEIDIVLVETVIDKRIFRLNNNEYRLKVEKLVLTDVLKLWVSVEKNTLLRF